MACLFEAVSVTNFRVLTTFARRKTNCKIAKYRNIFLGFSLGDILHQFVEHYMTTVILPCCSVVLEDCRCDRAT